MTSAAYQVVRTLRRCALVTKLWRDYAMITLQSVVAVFSDRRITRRHRDDDDVEVISVSGQSSTSSVQALPYTKLNRDVLARAGWIGDSVRS